jgi:hypothetical protein
VTERREAIERLMERARNEPEFFHRLVFDPERTIAELDYLGRREKAMLVSRSPEDVVSGLVGLIRGPGDVLAVCGHSCEDSCDSTCGAGSCFGTCLSDTCGFTCGAKSCDITVAIESRGEFGESRGGFGPGFGRTVFRPRQRR